MKIFTPKMYFTVTIKMLLLYLIIFFALLAELRFDILLSFLSIETLVRFYVDELLALGLPILAVIISFILFLVGIFLMLKFPNE